MSRPNFEEKKKTLLGQLEAIYRETIYNKPLSCIFFLMITLIYLNLKSLIREHRQKL